MKKLAIFTIILTFGLFITGNIMAAGVKTSSGEMNLSQHHRASQVIGKEVRSQGGEELGEVSDLMFDSRGNIDYVILSRGGVMGVGNNLVPIPWQAFNPAGAREALIVNVDKAKFESAPKFSEDDWANFNRPEWRNEVRGYYGVEETEGMGVYPKGNDENLDDQVEDGKLDALEKVNEEEFIPNKKFD